MKLRHCPAEHNTWLHSEPARRTHRPIPLRGDIHLDQHGRKNRFFFLHFLDA